MNGWDAWGEIIREFLGRVWIFVILPAIGAIEHQLKHYCWTLWPIIVNRFHFRSKGLPYVYIFYVLLLLKTYPLTISVRFVSLLTVRGTADQIYASYEAFGLVTAVYTCFRSVFPIFRKMCDLGEE